MPHEHNIESQFNACMHKAYCLQLKGQIRPLDENALAHTINMMPWRTDELGPKLREFAAQLWIQFCSVPAAPSDEPFGYFRPDPFGWTDCAKDEDGAIALYERPQAQAQAVPSGEPSGREVLTQVFALCEDTENMVVHYGGSSASEGFTRGRKFEAKGIRNAIGTWFKDASATTPPATEQAAVSLKVAKTQADPGRTFYEAHCFAFDMRAGWESLPESYRHRYAIAEAKAALADTTATDAGVVEDAERCPPTKVLMEHSGCGQGTQVDTLTVRLNPGDKVILQMGHYSAASAKEQS